MTEPDFGPRMVRVIGGAGDGEFAPVKTIFIDSTGHGPTDVYVLRDLSVDGQTVTALVLTTLTDPVAVRMYREHVANGAERN